MVNQASLDNKENIFEIQAEQRKLLLFTSNPDLNEDKISEVASFILDKEQSDNPKPLLKVRLKEYSQNKLSYTLLESEVSKTVDIPELLIDNTIKKIKNLSLPDLLPKPPRSHPIISFLKTILELVTHPIRFFTKEDHVLSRRSGMPSRHTFKATIQFALSQLQSSQNPESKELAKLLSKGQNIMDQIYQDLSKGKSFENGDYFRYAYESMIIPIGVGEGKDYIPHFIYISREKGTIRDIHLSSPSAERKVFTETIYKIINQNNVEILSTLVPFIPLDIQPQSEERPSFKSTFFKWVPGYDYLKSLFEKKPLLPISEHSSNPINTLGDALKARGFELVDHSKGDQINSTSADPLKLMFELCNKFEPASKSNFYRSWVEMSIRTLNESRSSMSPNERKKAIEVLKREVKSLGKALADEYGIEVSKEIVNEVKKGIEIELDFKGAIKAREADRIQRINVEPAPFEVKVSDSSSNSDMEVRAPALNRAGGFTDRLDSEFVRIFNHPAPSHEQCIEVLATLNRYLDEVDQAHNEGDFNITKTRLLALLKALPIPTARHSKENGIFWNQLDKAGLDEAMRTLSRLSNLVWERVLKAWDFPIAPTLLLEMNMVLSANLRYLYSLRVQIALNVVIQKLEALPKAEYDELNESIIKQIELANFYSDTVKDKLMDLIRGLSKEQKNYYCFKFRDYLKRLHDQFFIDLGKTNFDELIEKYKNEDDPEVSLNSIFANDNRIDPYLKNDKIDPNLTRKVISLFYLNKVENALSERDNEELLQVLKEQPLKKINLNLLTFEHKGQIARKLDLPREELAFFVLVAGVDEEAKDGFNVIICDSPVTSFSSLNAYRKELNLLYASDSDYERLIALRKLENTFPQLKSAAESHLSFYKGYVGREANNSEKANLLDAGGCIALNLVNASNCFLDPYLVMLKEHNTRIDLLNRPLLVNFHSRPLISAIKALFTTTDIDWIKKTLRSLNRLNLKVAEDGVLKKRLKYVITNQEGQFSDILIVSENPFYASDREGLEAIPTFIVDKRVNNRAHLLGAAQNIAEVYYNHNTLLKLFSDLVTKPNKNLNLYEAWKLNALQLMGFDDVKDSLTTREMGLTTVTIKLCLEFICQYPNLLIQDVVQHHVYNLFTQPYLLKSALISDPQYFIDIAPKLRKALDEIPKTDHLSILFVLNLCDKIHEEVSWIELFYKNNPTEDNQELWINFNLLQQFVAVSNEIHSSIPQVDSDMVHRLFRLQRESNLQRGYATFLMDHTRKAPPRNPSEIVNALQAYFILSVSPATVGHPYVVNAVLEFGKLTFLPHIAHQLMENKELRRVVLSELTKIDSEWSSTQSIYQFKAESDDSIVDISNGMGFALLIRDASDCLLPDSVLSSDTFKTAFGIDFKPRVRSSSKENGIIEYSFELNNVEFRINVKRFSDQFEIYQLFEGVLYKFNPLKVGNSALKIGDMITQNGVWVNRQTNQRYLARHGNLLKNERILLHFKQRFYEDYESLVGGSIGEGRNRVWICQDKYRIIMRAVNCCSSHQVLMSTGHDKKRIQRLDFPSELSLTRREGDTWVQENRPELQWWLQETEFLELEFGHEYTEFMLPLKNTSYDNAYMFWIYPYSILASGKTDSKLNFLKPIDDQPSPKALKLEKTYKGYHGDHGAFLYLAYYFYVRGEHSKAAKYLDLMWKFGKSDEQTIESFTAIRNFLISHKASTTIQRAFLLKALLNITLIENDYAGILGIVWTNTDSIIPHIMGLAEKYNSALSDPILSNRISQQGLMLKSHEVEFLLHLKGKKSEHVLFEPVMQLHRKLHVIYPTIDEMRTFAENLQNFTVSSKTSNIQALHKAHGAYPKIDTILTHFWDYVAWISTETDLVHSDVYFLYNSIPSLGSFEDPGSIKAIDTARRFLIMLYELKKTLIGGVYGVFDNPKDIPGKNIESAHLRHLREDVQKNRSGFPSKRINPNGELSAANLIQTFYYQLKDHKSYTTAAEAYFRIFYDYLINNKDGTKFNKYVGNLKIYRADQKHYTEDDIKASVQEVGQPYNFPFKEGHVAPTDLDSIRSIVSKVSHTIIPKPYSGELSKNAEWDAHFIWTDPIKKLPQKVSTVNSYLDRLHSRQDNHGDMVTAEVERIKASSALASQELSQKTHQKLKYADLQAVEEKLKAKLIDVKAQVNTLQKTLISIAAKHSSALGLFEDNPSKVIEGMIQMYLSDFWNGIQDEEIVTALDHTMTQFLLASTELQQLEKGTKVLKSLRTTNPESKTWEYRSTDLYYHLTEGSNSERINKYGQDYYKPFLVHEYQHKVICRDKAVDGVKDLIATKPTFAKIRMGVGKSTFIFHHLARLWLRKGVRPVVIFTEKLLRQSLGYMDQDAYVFSFDRNFGLPLSSGKAENRDADEINHLTEIYTTLTRLQAQGRYVVSTPKRRTALRTKKHELEADLKVLITNNNLSQLALTIKKLELVTKISEYFLDEKTRYLVDEDANLNINVEFNSSYGDDTEISKSRSSMANQLMHWLLIAPIDQPAQFNRLADLRTKIIEKKIHSLPYEEVEPALFQLAEFALKDEQFWVGTIGFTKGQYEKLKIDRSFVKFVMQQKDNKEFIVPKVIQNLQHESSGNENLKAALNKLEIFQIQLSETFKSVYKTHPDFRRGIQKASQCVIIPIDVIENPDVVFGDEDEMILQHYLFYAVSPPNNDYFDLKFRELSSKDTDGWKEWNETIGHGDSPYRNISKPQNVYHRLMFCRYILEESKMVRLYPQQLVSNSQDIYPDQPKSVASGTGYPFVINMSEPGKDNNSIDSIIGQTLLCMDLDRKVTVSSNILDDLVNLPNDPNCLGIINQAYSICGNDTRKFVDHLRTHSRTERNLVYVESGSREKKLSRKYKEPIPLPSDILGENDFLIIGPLDTVGIDFKLARSEDSYAEVLVGSTTVLDEFEQAINRLRDLGFGQQGRLRIDDVMAARITSWSGVPAQEITEGHVILDIILRTVADKSHNNVKAAVFRIKSVLKTRLEKALHKFTPDINGAKVHSAIFEGFRSIFIEDRTKKSSEKFSDTKMLSPKEFLNTIYDETLNQLRAFLDQAILNVAKLQDRHVTEELFNANKAMFYQMCDKENAKVPAELIRVYKAVRDAEKNLVDEQKKLSEWEQYFNKYLPKENPSNGNVNGMIELQILIQVQLKMEQMVHQIRNDIPIKHEFNAIKLVDVETKFTPEVKHDNHRPITLWVGTEKKLLPPAIGNEFKNFRMSKSAAFLFAKMNTTEHSVFYTLASLVDGNWQFCVVTQGEWSRSLNFDFVSKRKNPSNNKNETALYPLFWGNTDEMIPVDGKRPKSYTKEFVLEFSKLRFILGYTKFNEEEKRMLAPWLNSLSADAVRDLTKVFSEQDKPESQKLLNKLTAPRNELPIAEDPD